MSTTTIQINETDIEETIIKETIPNLSIIEKKSSVVFAETLESGKCSPRFILLILTWNQLEPQTPTETLIDDFDGGYGWLVVFGAFFFQLTSFGVEMSWYVRFLLES
jgi:hypothetical protein